MPDPFSFPDPFATLDPFAQAGYGGRRRQAAYPPLGEAETDAAIQGLTGTALSGLGYVGSELDKLFGGRAVRGLLGGKPRELLSLLPGSDVVGLTHEADTVSGDDLLRNVGYDPSQGNWLERNLAGPIVEGLLDPSMYLGGIGALTKTGKLAIKTSAVTKGFLPSIAKGERTLMHGLTGQGVADFAGGVADMAGKGLQAANVGVRRLPVVGGLAGSAIDAGAAGAKQARLVGRSLFDPKAGRVANETMQAANEFTRVPAEDAAMSAARESRFDLRRKLAPLFAAGVPEEDVYRTLTQMGEGVPVTPTPSMSNVLPAALSEVTGDIRELLDPLPAQSRALGVKSGVWTGDYDRDYMLARIAKAKGADASGVAKGSQPFSPANSSQIARKAFFDLPGGRVQLEDFIKDPSMSGERRAAVQGAESNKEATKAVRDKILGVHMAVPEQATTGTFPIDFKTRAEKKSGGLARYLGSVKPEFIGPEARDFFEHDIPGNVFERLRRSAVSDAKAKGVHDVVGRAGVEGGPGMAVTTALKKAGLSGEGAYESALRALKVDPLAVLRDAQEAAGEVPVDAVTALRDALKGYSLPDVSASALTKYMNPWKASEEWAAPLAGLDWLNSKFRDLTYSVWPASLGRNLASGVEQNAWMGTLPNSPAYLDQLALRRGDGIVTGLPGHSPLTPANQAEALAREMHGQNIAGSWQGQAGAAAGPGISLDPMAAQPSLGSLAAGFLKAPIETGKAINQGIEDFLRQSQYLDLRRKGFDAPSAAAEVFKNHFDYTRSTDFENAVMKRLIPFYTFPSRNIPKQIGRAIQSPGKISAPIRLSGVGTSGGGDEGYVPEYLQNGLALPLGDGANGTQTYLSQLGMPMEEAFSRLKVGKSLPDTLGKTGLGLLGMLRPELKGPLEGLTGKQFFTGRDMADLHVGKAESLGGIIDDENARVLSQVLANTPATRMLSTANRLLDERKYTPAGLAGLGLGLTTGARLTDVDTEKWRAVDARHNLEELMRGQPGIRQSTDYYPTPQAKAEQSLTPLQEQELRLYASMKLRARHAAEEKRRVGVQLGR